MTLLPSSKLKENPSMRRGKVYRTPKGMPPSRDSELVVVSNPLQWFATTNEDINRRGSRRCPY